MVPGGRLLIAISYKYNVHKVVYFIFTEDTRSTKAGINYLSKYPDHFSNVYICTVDGPLFISKFLGSVNEVESHNKSRQSDLALDKFWAT